MEDERVTLNHGAGGRAMRDLIRDLIHGSLGDAATGSTEDSALVETEGRVAFTTDSYVVSPLFFPGGDIGRLAVAGTCNDLATAGAVPSALSLALILEEGFPLRDLRTILTSAADCAREVGVRVVTGDTKVVPRGKADGLFINTAGVGRFPEGRDPLGTHRLEPGLSVFVTGPIGDHEIALMSARGALPFEVDTKSDLAPLASRIDAVLSQGVDLRLAKDATRGGVASVLFEVAEDSGFQIVLEEERIPLRESVRAVCELAGFEPLYLANEGTMVLIGTDDGYEPIRSLFPEATRIGRVEAGNRGLVMETEVGGLRRMGMLETVQLPRIC